MHKFSTVSAKPSALPVLRSVGLLNVPYSTFAAASVAHLVRLAFSPLRDENLCIIPARETLPELLRTHLSLTGTKLGCDQLAVKALKDQISNPTEEQIRHFLAGNICRCGCHMEILEVARSAL
jgi:xanthine dehydrogenase iron-sulfur cluster and FAD-binding subunit A